MLKEIAEDREKKKISGHQSDSVSTEPKELTPTASAGARPKMSSDSCQLQVRNHLKVTEREREGGQKRGKKRWRQRETERRRRYLVLSFKFSRYGIYIYLKVFRVKIPGIANNPVA